MCWRMISILQIHLQAQQIDPADVELGAVETAGQELRGPGEEEVEEVEGMVETRESVELQQMLACLQAEQIDPNETGTAETARQEDGRNGEDGVKEMDESVELQQVATFHLNAGQFSQRMTSFCCKNICIF